MIARGAWIDDPATQAVCAALTDAGFQALFVGGCVRNALLGVPVSDIDIATDARPEDTVRCAERAGLRAVPTGFEHGTITVVSGGIAHEITTFRCDIETDGRHAKVRFSNRIEEDAARRDFTMNALYARPDGTVLDPLGGIADLKIRRLKFINDAGARIREDYLRALRFFRFTAYYGDPALGINSEGLAAVASNLDGLQGLSKERVGVELKKLMNAPDPSIAVAAMRSCGALNAVLEGADDKALSLLVHFENDAKVAPNAVRRLAIVADASHAENLRLSKADKRRWAVLRDEIGSMKSASHLGYLHGSEIAQDVLLLRAAMFEQPVSAHQLKDTIKGETAVFPIKAKDLTDLHGPELGAALKSLEARWIASDFTLTREALLK